MSDRLDQATSRQQKTANDLALLIVGLVAIPMLALASAFMLTHVPLPTAALGAGIVALQGTRFRGPGMLQVISVIWGCCLFFLGLSLGIGGLLLATTG